MDRVKAALFIDFDNVFLSLKKDYSDAVAKRFANPSRWMPWLEQGQHAGGREDFPGERSLLIRRCYGSPDLMRPFRGYFTRLGFQVVDCPPLTSAGKNSADIVMTLDIADAIEHTTRFADDHMQFSAVAGGLVYDARRHKPPAVAEQRTGPLAAEATSAPEHMPEPMRDLLLRLYEVVGLPRLDSEQYQTVFDALAAESGKQTTLGEITKNARDLALDDGVPIGRQPFAFVTTALHAVGRTLSETRTEPGEIARLFRASVEQQAFGAQLELEAEDLRLLDELLGVATSG